ncbi:MAG: hypothetical protein V1913_12960, partial [Fibrobacterota bacterium]
VSENYYCVEMAIPFSALDTHTVASSGWTLPATWQPAVPPVLGSQWKFNVTRSDIYPDSGCFSCWSFNGNYAYGTGRENAHFHDHNNFGLLTFTDALAVEVAPARAGAVFSVTPNPWVAGAPVSVSLPAYSKGTRLGLYDIKGQCVLDLTDRLAASPWRISFRAVNLSSGVYCLTLVRADGVIVKKTVMMK